MIFMTNLHGFDIYNCNVLEKILLSTHFHHRFSNYKIKEIAIEFFLNVFTKFAEFSNSFFVKMVI